MGKKKGTAIGFGIYALELVSTPPHPLRVNTPQPLFNGITVGDIDCWGGGRGPVLRGREDYFPELTVARRDARSLHKGRACLSHQEWQ